MMRSLILTTLVIFLGLPTCLMIAVQFGMINLDPRHGNRRLNPGSIDLAQSQGVLVAQPTISTTAMQWQKIKYPISQIWIDQLVDEDIFFRRTVAGYRLKIRVENFNTRMRNPSWESAQMVCNKTIFFQSYLSLNDRTALWFADVTEPLPRSVSCEIRASQ